jgi:hypothetical protein
MYIYIHERKQNGRSVYDILLIHHVDCMNYLAENQAVAGGRLFTGLCVRSEMKISGHCANESANGCEVLAALCGICGNKVWATRCVGRTRFKCTGNLTVCHRSVCFNCLKERFWLYV